MREVGIGGVLGVLIKGQQPENGCFTRRWCATTACARTRSGPACSATPASRRARWGSSRRRSSTSCAAASSRRASCPANLQATLQTIHKSGNSFGERNRKRGRWTEELDFEVKDARKEPVDVLWFVGDYASFDPRSQKVTPDARAPLPRRGLDFGILYDGERNSGNDVRRAGEEGLFEALAEQNVATLEECDFNRIVTSDPHSLNTLRNEYPELISEELGGSWSVAHHTALLLELIESGPAAGARPARLPRDLPRPVLPRPPQRRLRRARRSSRQLGCTLVEMPRNRDNSFCCGAGGGRIWIPDEPGVERPSENRIREAVALGELDYFVVSCPKDVTMYEDAIKTSGNAERIELRELTELIEEALGTPDTPSSPRRASRRLTRPGARTIS